MLLATARSLSLPDIASTVLALFLLSIHDLLNCDCSVSFTDMILIRIAYSFDTDTVEFQWLKNLYVGPLKFVLDMGSSSH